MIWTTKSGKKIKVENMTDDHILYALRLCMRVQVQLNEMLADERLSLEFGSELSQMINLAGSLIPWISIFDKEIIKRGLTPLPIEELQHSKVSIVKSLPDDTILNLETEST